jgi:hypothetical protein
LDQPDPDFYSVVNFALKPSEKGCEQPLSVDLVGMPGPKRAEKRRFGALRGQVSISFGTFQTVSSARL